VATLNLTFPQGATWSLALTWNDDDGDPINLTGYTARMQVRITYGAAATILSLANGSGITLGGAAGTITLSVAATTTATVNSGTYVYDLELQSGGGEVTRLVEGTLEVTPEVTR
jgi:hypothetical protein